MRRQNKFLDTEELENYGNQMLNLISNGLQNLDKYPIVPKIMPGDFRKLLPRSAN